MRDILEKLPLSARARQAIKRHGFVETKTRGPTKEGIGFSPVAPAEGECLVIAGVRPIYRDTRPSRSCNAYLLGITRFIRGQLSTIALTSVRCIERPTNATIASSATRPPCSKQRSPPFSGLPLSSDDAGDCETAENASSQEQREVDQ
jgi:hypothetical protein